MLGKAYAERALVSIYAHLRSRYAPFLGIAFAFEGENTLPDEVVAHLPQKYIMSTS